MSASRQAWRKRTRVASAQKGHKRGSNAREVYDRVMSLRRIASRFLPIVALAFAPAISACAESRPPRSAGPPGKIEALREGQEKAQKRIEAEGRANELQVERERQAVRAEAEREREDRAGGGH
jgi:hypothetical protein